MGIKNLMQIIKKFAPNSIQNVTIKNYTGKILAIDANLMIYKSVFGLRKNGYDLKNGDIVTTHIHTLIMKLLGFIRFNITPIFVFDGQAPDIKQDTLKKRSDYTKEINVKYENAIDIDEKKKYFYRKSHISTKEFNECKELVRLFGFPIIECTGEADPICAHLSQEGLVDGIVTDDMDILLFGGTRILKNFSINDKKKFQEINLAEVLKSTKLTQTQLIELGILLGSDYTETMKGGLVTLYRNITEYKSIKNMAKKNIITIKPDYTDVVKYFTNKNKVDNKLKYNKSDFDYNGIKSFLTNMQFKKESIEKYISKMKK